ncbi:MAG: hypothetical protein NTX53_00990 [candidate division WOR-3 bacterium]|nr:hypothetical protein [candidate division WOR-3 bacterium]
MTKSGSSRSQQTPGRGSITARARGWLGASIVIGLLVLVGCGGNGRAPLNLRLEADTDSTVKVVWSVPVDATPDEYLVYFRAVGETSYSLVAETTANLWSHNPSGATGWYRVEAKYGGETYAAGTNPSTVPVRTDTVALAELNAAGNSGFGWERSTGRGRTCPMTSRQSVRSADLYITDFKPPYANQQPYSVASPDMGPSDPGNVVPSDSWRVNVFTDTLPDENAMLPSYSETAYFNFTDMLRVPCNIGCHTADGHYALVKVVGVDVENCWVRVETWYQLVPGLRLIRH